MYRSITGHVRCPSPGSYLSRSFCEWEAAVSSRKPALYEDMWLGLNWRKDHLHLAHGVLYIFTTHGTCARVRMEHDTWCLKLEARILIVAADASLFGDRGTSAVIGHRSPPSAAPLNVQPRLSMPPRLSVYWPVDRLSGSESLARPWSQQPFSNRASLPAGHTTFHEADERPYWSPPVHARPDNAPCGLLPPDFYRRVYILGSACLQC